MRNRLPLLPAALLCLVALAQVYLTQTYDLTPWKGGGFGMFSTNDGDSRRVEVWDLGPGRPRLIELPVDARTRAAVVLPSVSRLLDVAEEAMEEEKERGNRMDRVRVVVLRLDYDPRTMRPRQIPIGEIVVDFRSPENRSGRS